MRDHKKTMVNNGKDDHQTKRLSNREDDENSENESKSISDHSEDSICPLEVLSEKFKKTFTALANIYDLYSQRRGNEQSMIKPAPRLDDCLAKIESLNLNDLSKPDLFAYFVELIDRLIEFIFNSKRDDFQTLYAFFKNTNLVIIQFYEFINRLISVFSDASAFGISSSNSSRETKNIIVGKAFELLHALLINSTEEQDEYAASLCSLVATSFNFTSPICRLLVSIKKAKSEHEASLGENNVKIAFSILNELTANNKLLFIDNNVKQLVFDILDRILKNCFHPMHVQFLSNTLRNDTTDIENIIKSIVNKVRELYRQLISIILNKQIADVVLNSLIILIKLKYDSMFSILWQVSSLGCGGVAGSSVGGGSSSVSGVGNGRSVQGSQRQPFTATTMFEPFDLSLQVLDDNSLQFSSKLNAINFLLEFVKFDQVKTLLENNDAYASLFLFKLKLFMIDKGSERKQKLPKIITSKILSIFNQLSLSSDKLSHKLFGIVFNTRKFVEGGGTDDATSRKLKGILMAIRSGKNTSTKPGAQAFELFIDYFLRLADIQLESSSSSIRVCDVQLTTCFLDYLLNLVKKNENMSNVNDFREYLEKIKNKLLENLSSFEIIFKSSEHIGKDDELTIDRLYFYNLAILDSIYKMCSDDTPETETIQKLMALLESMTWLSSSEVIDRSMNSTPTSYFSILNKTHIFITIKLLIRLAFVNSNPASSHSNLQQKILVYIKSHHFMEILCRSIIDANDYVTQLLTFELVFQLRDITNENPKFLYNFPIETFIKTLVRLKEVSQESRKYDRVSNMCLLSSDGSSPFLSAPGSCKPASRELADLQSLVEFYEFKIAQQNEQEAHVMNILNMYFAKNQVKEAENLRMRGQLKILAQKCFESKKEIEENEKKNSDIVMKLESISKLQADMERSYEELQQKNTTQVNEMKNLLNKYNDLKRENETIKKDNEESTKALQDQINSEVAEKNELAENLRETNEQLSQAQEQQAEMKTRINELKDSLEAKQVKLDETIAQLTTKTAELESTRNDVQKLKSILSYVKNADF